MIPIIPICVGDNIEIAVNIYSLRGLVDADSINWQPPSLQQSPHVNILNYNRDINLRKVNSWGEKILADLGRVCELEDSQAEWEDYRMIKAKNSFLNVMFNMKNLEPFFQFQKVKFSGMDIKAFRMQLLAIRPGIYIYIYI